LSFFRALHERLRDDTIDLSLVYGDVDPEGNIRADTAELPPPIGTPVRNIWFFSRRALYQPVWPHLRHADLVVVEQANKNLQNYFLTALSSLDLIRVAYWGHGRDFAAPWTSLSERLKRVMATRVDWWFAYTNGIADYIASLGFPRERITAVQNTIDVEAFARDLGAITLQELTDYRIALGVPPGAHVALHCGSLHAGRNIPFLLEAARAIKDAVPTFHLLVAGDGPALGLLRQTAEDAPWIHVLGRVDGAAKALAFRLAQVFLNPGVVGLAIVDAFTAGLPVITTDLPSHPPEIEYLRPDYNGRVVEPVLGAFAKGTACLLTDATRRSILAAGARETVRDLTVAKMVDRFASGILTALAT
jgi:glycosyltransferase involved in cell wall biosynthesis